MYTTLTIHSKQSPTGRILIWNKAMVAISESDNSKYLTLKNLTSGSSNSSTSNPPSCGSDCCNIDGVHYTRDQVTKCDTASCTVGR